MAAGQHQSRAKLVDAALTLVRSKGYSATRVDDICGVAGVTKGSFFHHFQSKDDLALAAAELWRHRARSLFAAMETTAAEDPLDRLFAYLALRKSLMTGDLAQWTCFAGTMIQETYATHPHLRVACEKSMAEHSASLAEMIAAAMRQYGVTSDDWSAESLALHIQGVIQGAFIMAKAEGQAKVATDSIDHLQRYLGLLFKRSGHQ
jgi:TetR/AcrR family transcriptional repressor of nem operon